jgi:HNH endonuclease
VSHICAAPDCESPTNSKGLCIMHYQRMKSHGSLDKPPARVYAVKSLEERFWAQVDRQGDDECWPWTGHLSRGYGQFHVQYVSPRRTIRPHRFSYELLVGPIPDGLQLDHLCRNRACVNPQHLEPVTAQENNRRSLAPSAINAAKTACVHGHEFTPENTGTKNGTRFCRQCARDKKRAQNARLSAEKAAKRAAGLVVWGGRPGVRGGKPGPRESDVA